jgi:diamine N-acetyltransferase
VSGPARFDAAGYELASIDGAALTLSRLGEADARRLAEFFAAMNPWADYGYPAVALGDFLSASEPGAPRFALALDGVVVGAAVIRTAWLRGPYLQFLALVAEAQGRGIGTAMLMWLERQARVADERNLWVAASQINADAIRFYERHGFVPVAELDGLACDERTEILFRKRLV